MAKTMMTHTFAALTTACLLACAPAHSQQAAPDEAGRVDHDTVSKAAEDDIARELENPIGNLTVLPFENYTNFGVGPNKGLQNILEFEPVVPVHPQRGLEPDQPRRHPCGLESRSVAVPERAAGFRADRLFRVPLAPKTFRRLDRGGWPDRPDPDRHQPERRLQRLGPRPDCRCRPYLRTHRRRRAAQQCLVGWRRRVGTGREALFDIPPGAFLQLQFWPGLVRQLRAAHHRRLGYPGKEMDRAGRPCRRPRSSSSEASCWSNCRSAATTTS